MRILYSKIFISLLYIPYAAASLSDHDEDHISNPYPHVDVMDHYRNGQTSTPTYDSSDGDDDRHTIVVLNTSNHAQRQTHDDVNDDGYDKEEAYKQWSYTIMHQGLTLSTASMDAMICREHHTYESETLSSLNGRRLHEEDGNVKYVDIFIGTGGYGYGACNNAPSVQLPHGYVRLSADTSLHHHILVAWRQSSGYHYCDDTIRAFSHTRLLGTYSHTQYGTLGMMPIGHINRTILSCNYHHQQQHSDSGMKMMMQSCGFKRGFNHHHEKGSAAYYKTRIRDIIDDGDIDIELTATHFVGIHRYTWNNHHEHTRYVIIHANHQQSAYHLPPPYAQLTINTSTQQVYGHIMHRSSNDNNDDTYNVYFVVQFNHRFDDASSGTWSSYNGEGHVHGILNHTIQGDNIGAYIGFDHHHDIVSYVALSLVSIDHAHINMQSQINQRTFNDLHHHSKKLWNSYLDTIIATGLDNDLIIMYSALHRSAQSPSLIQESVNHSSSSLAQWSNGMWYTDVSPWDSWSTSFPLLQLLHESIAIDVIYSLFHNHQHERIVKFLVAGHNGSTTPGNGVIDVSILLCDALINGLIDDTPQLSYEWLMSIAKSSIDHRSPMYRKNGYEYHVVSPTLEYSLIDYCFSNAFQRLGLQQQALKYRKLSMNWRKLLNPRNGYFCPRDENGVFHRQCKNSQYHQHRAHAIPNPYYTEGSSEQWRWFVPHSPERLARYIGVDTYISNLQHILSQSLLGGGDSTTLESGKYSPASQATLHVIYSFLYVNRPDLTQFWINQLYDLYFTRYSDGIPGNDDFGVLSSWVVWTNIGLYPRVCTGEYLIGTPRFKTMTLHIRTHHHTSVAVNMIAHGWDPFKAYYVRSVTWNGKRLNGFTISRRMLLLGGDLEFYMTNSPSKPWWI